LPVATSHETEAVLRQDRPIKPVSGLRRLPALESAIGVTARDDEQRFDVSEAMIHVALGSLILRRISD